MFFVKRQKTGYSPWPDPPYLPFPCSLNGEVEWRNVPERSSLAERRHEERPEILKVEEGKGRLYSHGVVRAKPKSQNITDTIGKWQNLRDLTVKRHRLEGTIFINLQRTNLGLIVWGVSQQHSPSLLMSVLRRSCHGPLIISRVSERFPHTNIFLLDDIHSERSRTKSEIEIKQK